MGVPLHGLCYRSDSPKKGLRWSRVARSNTGCPVKFEFQINEGFLFKRMSCVILGIYQKKKNYLFNANSNFSGYPAFLLATSDNCKVENVRMQGLY